MNRLVIKLNAVTENVTVGLISKLYSTAKAIKDYEELNDVQNSQVELLGNLLVVHAYGSDVTYLEAKFPNLHINVTGGTYVKFVDPLVQSILLSNNVGDGVGCTLLDLYNINSLSGDVFGGSSITSFNEFQYFNPAILLLANLFVNCSSLTEITLPVGTTLIRSGWFGNCSNLVTINNTQSITTITGLGGCSSLVSLNTPALTNVENWGCMNCTSLTTIDLSHCTSIGRNAFQGCTSLDNIDLSSCTTIGQEAFRGCTSLTSIDLSNVTRINALAFHLCSSLSSIDLTGLTYLEDDGFRECSSLTTISMPNCTYIGGGSFRNCTSLLSITFASNVTHIGGYMCEGCRNLTLAQLPSNITQLTPSFFRGCTSLTSVTIPSTVTTIEDYAFFEAGITSISIPSAVTKLGTDCFTKSLLVSITFEPNSTLNELGGGCFNLTKLVTIDIPDSCTTIRSNCFMNSNTLTSITIGTGILTIEDAFTVANGLVYTLTVKATTPPTFTRVNSKKPTAIYVPSTSVSAYLLADGWSAWADVIQAIQT